MKEDTRPYNEDLCPSCEQDSLFRRFALDTCSICGFEGIMAPSAYLEFYAEKDLAKLKEYVEKYNASVGLSPEHQIKLIANSGEVIAR